MNRMTEHNVDGVVFRTADRFSAAGGVVHGFSTRYGGVSQGVWSSMNLGLNRGDDPAAVRENYRRFFSALGASQERIVMSSQVHESHIQAVTWEDGKQDLYDPVPFQADGLVTDCPGVALVIFSADCLPILFYDPVKKVVAASHSGWRGTVAEIGPKTVEKMVRDYGCRREDILAGIGPGISACHFETTGDVPAALRAVLPGEEGEACIQDHKDGTYHVDLKQASKALLERAGLLSVHITVDPDCTACHGEKYWSHRMVGAERGSLIAVIQLT